MKYEDAFEECLAGLRRGEPLDAVLGRYPEHASDLRKDLLLAGALRELPGALPSRAGSEQRAWASVQTELRSQRQAQAARHSPVRGFLALFGKVPRMMTRTALVGGAVAVVAVIALALSTASGGPNLSEPVSSLLGSANAEAASFDGVVVENANGVLTVQTATSLETVSVAGTATINGGGRSLSLPDLAAGQAVSVRGKRLGNGNVAALTIESQNMAALRDWCSLHSEECQKLRDRLEAVVGQCRTSDRPACQSIELRLRELRDEIAGAAGRIDDLKGRCDSGGALACHELKRICDQYKNLCKGANQKAPGQKGRY